jgi:hypothetical protein
VTVALLPQFVAIFDNIEEDSSFPSVLATTILAFGEDFQTSNFSVLLILEQFIFMLAFQALNQAQL